MKKQTLFIFTVLILIQVSTLYSQYCVPFEIVETDFQAESKYVKVEAEW